MLLGRSAPGKLIRDLHYHGEQPDRLVRYVNGRQKYFHRQMKMRTGN